MSTKATIFLTNDNDHWYRELNAKLQLEMDTPDNEAVVLEFGPDCKIEDYGSDGFGVAIPSDNALTRIILSAARALNQAELQDRTPVNELSHTGENQ